MTPSNRPLACRKERKIVKKFVSILLLLCMTLATPLALAADQPFEPGVNYSNKNKDYGCVHSMLNFGSANLGPGESFYDVETTTIKKGSAKNVEKSLGRMSYYCYAKWQNAQTIDYNYIDAMLVMTDPKGNYYATYAEWEQIDLARKTVCSWFIDVTNCLERCVEDHGSLPKGQYTFSLFFNDQSFRVAKVPLS